MATKPYEIQDIDKKMPAVIQSLKDKENPFSYKSVSSLQASEAAKKGEWRLAVWCPDETTAKKRAKDLNARACIGERTLPPMPKAEKPGSPVQQMVDFKVEEAKKPKAPGKDGMRGAGYTGKGVKQGKGQPMNKLRASADELDLVLYVAVPKKFTEGVDLNGVYVNDLNSDLQGQIIARAQDAQVYLSEGNIDASLKASSLKEGDVLQHEDGKPYGRVYNVSPNWIALMDENNKKTMHLPGDLEEDLESGAIKIVSSLKADYTGACAECGKNVGSANITMSGAPGKRYCSQACVDAAYKKQSPTDKKKGRAESDRAKMSGSKIKADDIGRADDEEEESWDTAEVSRWIANDESLYLAARGVRNAREMEETLQPMMEGNKHIDVDWNEIDWQAVYNDMDNADTDVEGQAQRRAQAGRIFTARAKHPMRYARMRASRMKASEDDEAKAKQFMKHIISRLTKKLAKGNYENFGQEELSDFEEYLSKTSGLGYSQKANLKSELSKQIEDMQ